MAPNIEHSEADRKHPLITDFGLYSMCYVGSVNPDGQTDATKCILSLLCGR